MSSVSYNYDIANRVTDANGVPYVYDNNGNLLNDGQNTYAYDSANRLTSVNGTGSYTYNGLGDRLSQNGVNYTLDLNSGLTQVLSDGTTSYTYGLGRISQQSGTTAEYFLGDALGSVRQMANQTGAISFAQTYNPYGVVTQTSGASHTDYGFTGESYDTYIKLIDLRSRMYSPVTGRFTSKDSWLGDYNRPLSLNRWNYTEGNPVNYTNPSGYIAEGQEAARAQVIVDKLKIYYSATVVKDWGYQTFLDRMNLVPYCEWQKGLWTVDQLSTVLSSFNKIRNRLNVSEAKVAKIMGITTFRRVDKIFSLRVNNPIADSSPSGLVRLTAEAFDTEWYILHELGHIFDFQRIEGNLKSQRFIDEFKIPCAWNDYKCPYTYNPSDIDTTPYGLTSVLEDFADTFAVTILFNGFHGELQSQKRIDIMNDLLSITAQG